MISGAYVLITNKCNLNCTYCYERLESMSVGQDMKWETMQRLLDMLVDQYEPTRHANVYSDLNLNFFGGEPFFNWEVMKKAFEYVENIREMKGVRFSLYILTNGSIWTQEIHDFLAKYKPMMGKRLIMQISIDGCEASHNAARPMASGEGSFKTIVENIKKYRQILPDLQLRETIVPEKIDMLYEDYVTLSNLVDVVQMTPIIEADWKPNIDKARDQLNKIYSTYLEQIKTRPNLYLSLLNGTIINANVKGQSCYSKDNYKGCHAGRELIGVTVDGQIYPCHRFIAYKKRFDYRMGDLWKGIDKDAEATKEMYNVHFANQDCEKCGSYTCNRCYATNKVITGDAKARPSTGYCEFCAMNQQLVDKLSDFLVINYNNTLPPWTAYKSPTTKGRVIIMPKGKKILSVEEADLLIQASTKQLQLSTEIQQQNSKIIPLLEKIVEKLDALLDKKKEETKP